MVAQQLVLLKQVGPVLEVLPVLKIHAFKVVETVLLLTVKFVTMVIQSTVMGKL